MKQYNFQNNYGVIAWRKVCSCAPMFKFSYRPQNFSWGGNFFYQKLPFLAIFWAVSPHLLSQNGKIWREGANLGDRPQAKFCKNSLKGVYPFWANLYQKLPISAILGVVSPHFKSDNGEIRPQSTDLGYPPPALNFVKIAHGDFSLGEIFTKNSKCSRFLATWTLISIPMMLKFYWRERAGVKCEVRGGKMRGTGAR